MTASTTEQQQPMGALDPKVGEALINDNSVLEIMQHPKMSEALQALKKDPNQYHSLINVDAASIHIRVAVIPD